MPTGFRYASDSGGLDERSQTIEVQISLVDYSAFKQWDFLLVSDLAVGLKYSDLASAQRTQSVIRFGWDASTTEPPRGDARTAEVQSVELFHCDETWKRDDDPFVSTGWS